MVGVILAGVVLVRGYFGLGLFWLGLFLSGVVLAGVVMVGVVWAGVISKGLFHHVPANGYYVRNYRSEEEVFNSIFPITRTSFTRGLKNLHESPELNALNKQNLFQPSHQGRGLLLAFHCYKSK